MTNHNIQYLSKAKVALIDFGVFSIEGLLLGFEGDKRPVFGIGVSQVAALFSIPPKNISRTLKRLLGEGFQFLRASSELHPKKVNYISLETFERVILRLTINGNETAIEMSEMLIGLSLQQRFCDGFGVKFELEERNLWCKARGDGKRTRRTLTDSIQDYIRENGSSCPPHFLYANCTNQIYKALWGMEAKELEANLGCGRHESRDHMTSDQLKVLDRAEARVMEFIDEDKLHPTKGAVDAAGIRRKQF